MRDLPERIWVRITVSEKTFHLIGNAPVDYRTSRLSAYFGQAKGRQYGREEYVHIDEYNKVKDALRWIEMESRDGSRVDFAKTINLKAKEGLK